MRNRVRLIPAGVGLLLAAVSTVFGSIDLMLSQHETDSVRIDSLERAMPFLEGAVASTMRDGSSTPISFQGEVQLRSLFHNYNALADSSYLYLTRQGMSINGDSPLIKLGMIISPGRNTTLWTRMGVNAAFHGYNPYGFINPGETTKDFKDKSFFRIPSHGADGKGISLYEDLSAGIAIRTRPASFMLKLGSMNWTEASPLSIWKAQSRMFAWEYLPYEIEQPIAQYYNYNLAKGEKTGRAAWNKRPFQGIDFSIVDLPGDVRGFFSYSIGSPFDTYQRSYLDMAVDLGYAADAGSITGTGIADSYRKQVFYRVEKQFGRGITVGFNNGYTQVDEDIIQAGYEYANVFNTRFNVGRYNSDWRISSSGETIRLDNMASREKLEKLYSADPNSIEAISLGEGFVVKPRVFTLDAKGSIGEKVTFHADIAGTWVDTNYIRISPDSYDDLSGDPTADVYTDYLEGTKVVPGSILDTRVEKSPFDIAAYVSTMYHSKVNIGLNLLYAGENFYSPYSFVNPVDAFWAYGSNMVGAGKFVNSTEASPYSKNLRSAQVTVAPNFPWYGHLKVGYQLNSQNKKGRDLIFVPYRLNGASVNSTLNGWYSHWGVGKIDESYDFNHHQGGDDEGESFAKHPGFRLGDQSYTGGSSPVSGGLRSDANSLYEGFVPFTSAQEAIFNYYSGSSVVDESRDLASIWVSTDQKFVDMRDSIKNIKVTEANGEVSYYSLEGDNLIIEDANGTVLKNTIVDTKSETGFVPTSIKKSFDLYFDWALDIGKYIGYQHDLFMSLYYEVNGVTRSVMPMAFDPDNDDVLLISHYLRTEPAIALNKNLYIIGLFGVEKWVSGKTWVGEFESVPPGGKSNPFEAYGLRDKLIGVKESRLETTDFALGLGFDWDMMKRVSLHGRYKWFTHKDENLASNNYTGQTVSLELKAFF